MIRKILVFSQDSVCKKLKPTVNYLINLLVDKESIYNSSLKIGLVKFTFHVEKQMKKQSDW